MEKAWDIKDLSARLKARGIDVAEEAAMIMTEEVLAWTQDSIVKSDTKLDDLALPAIPLVEKQLKSLVDKINGKQG